MKKIVKMKLLTYCNKVIEYSFYALFFLVPLVFSGNTSELFELNKMWLTWGITAIIGAAWASKMILQKRFVIQRTPIDILLLLFLLSQIISTIFSLDSYVSWWGYYSRFNGGLLSTITYIVLYYAFVSNLKSIHVLRTMVASLISGLCVAIWGFPSHFGADPTCLVFRGNFDTSCWTDAFKPTIRAFSTLGQPAWLAAYMAFLLPISMAYTLKNKTKKVTFVSLLLLTILLYLLLLFSDTRAGYLGFWAGNIIFWGAIFFKKIYPKKEFFKLLIIINIFLIISSFMFGHSLDSIKEYAKPLFPHPAPTAAPAPTQTQTKTQTGTTSKTSASKGLITQGITDSGKIRLLVWQGAIRAWEHNPIFGTGVETFAFAYYKYKLPAHNLTSEWDYLYNKAHNEYLNYLATTGIFGLGTYLGFIGIFLFMTFKWYINKGSQKDKEAFKEVEKPMATTLIVLGVIAGYTTILISNFFGFSVVIINLYVFLTPAFIFILLRILKNRPQLAFPASTSHEKPAHQSAPTPFQWTMIVIFIGIACWMIFGLIWFRQADIAYALGNNLDKVGDYKQAYPQLVQAVKMEPDEPTYKDELAINLAALGAILYSQNNTSEASQAAQNAIGLSSQVVTNHPNNVVFWKDRVRVFYTLSAGDKKDTGAYLRGAVQAIDAAKNLAPTDAKIAYNQGVLYGQVGDLTQAVKMLNQTIKLKPDYLDAYIALGLFYHQLALDKNGKVVNTAMQKKAVDTYNFILKRLDPTNPTVKKSLEQWRTSQ